LEFDKQLVRHALSAEYCVGVADTNSGQSSTKNGQLAEYRHNYRVSLLFGSWLDEERKGEEHRIGNAR
jgi:hypothetical protein